jgi:phage protein D
MMPAIPGDYSATVRPVIGTGMMGSPLSPTVLPSLLRVVVDQHLLLPDMFEITFIEDGTTLATTMITIGTQITIAGGAADSNTSSVLIKGEVTSIEGDYENNTYRSIVRGYEKAHRLQRARRTRTFTNVTDADIVSKVCSEAQIDTDTVDSPGVTYEYVAQVNQTDWDFLQTRAHELGYQVSFTDNKLSFKMASGSTAGGGGGLAGAAMSAAASAVGLGSGKLTFGKNLLWFKPRLSAANIVPEVEVRVWDPKAGEVVSSKHDIESGTAHLSKSAKDLAGMFDGPFAGLPFTPPSIPGLPSLGPSASDKAILSVTRPANWGSSTSAATDAMAIGIAEAVGSAFAEAEGYAFGSPDIKSGAEVDVDKVPDDFKGKWTVTQARHIFQCDEGGYHTHFVVSGRNERSLLGLTSSGGNRYQPKIDGFVVGIVTGNNDPDTMGRVQLSFPWLSPAFQSDWARVVQTGAGTKWGTCFIPEVGDEVLVGFEFGDVRRPYVVGGLFNGNTDHSVLSGAVKAQGMSAQVVKHGIVSRLGNQIVFADDEPVPDSPPPAVTESSITISDKDGKMVILLDKKNGEIQILCDSMTPPGKITIEQKGTGGEISIKAAGNVSIEAAAPGQLSLKGGMGVSIDGGSGMVELKGSMVKLN